MNYQFQKKMKMKKHNYYKIRSGFFPDIIKICFSNEQYQSILKDYEIKENTIALQSGVAETHFIQNNYLGIIIGVFNLAEMGDDVASVSGTIAHEASHIIDRVAEYIGEDHITHEVRAYFTQFLVENIWLCIIEEKKQNARKQNRELSREASKEKRRAKSKVDKHDNGSAGSNSVPEKADPLNRTEVEYWKNIAKTENSLSDIVGPGVPSHHNKLP